MATANNTIKTRIQLKSDTEANWNKAGPKNGSNGFVPLQGELIVYTADATHPFSRLKVGDGSTNVVSLPFIDSGTLNGTEVELVKVNTFNDLPLSGSPDKLYVDLSTNHIFHYTGASGYTQLAKFTFTTTRASEILQWRAGIPTEIRLNNNTLILNNGLLPSLNYETKTVLQDVMEGGNSA